jgi:O-antigen ligase
MVSRAIVSAHKVASRVRELDATALLTFFLVLLMAVPSRLVFTPLGAAGTPATLVGVALLGWYLFTWLNPAAELARGRQPMRLAALLFLCTILVTYISASRHEMPTSELNGLDRGLILVAGWLGVLLVAADGIASMERLKTLVRRIVLGATILSVFGVVQAFTAINVSKYIIIPGLSDSATFQNTLTRGDLVRPSATTINPLEFAVVVGMCLPLAIYLARNDAPGLRRRRWLQVALIGAAQVMTSSRTSILALIAAGVAILPTWTRRERRVAYGVIAFSGIVLFLTVHGLLGTIKNLFLSLSSDSSAQSRTSAWSSAGPFISQHPWFGRGFSTFFPQTYFFTDDQYLGTLIETGVVGLLVLIGLLATGWFTARSTRRASTDGQVRDLAQCLGASVAVATVSFATFDALSFPMAASLTFMLLGCVGALWRLSRSTIATPKFSQPQTGQLVLSARDGGLKSRDG